MLKLLRRKNIRKRILYILAAIIIPAFVIWGSSSVMQKDKLPNYAGIIFNRKISYDDFRHAYAGWQTQLKLQYGDKAREIASTLFNPAQAAWDRLILLHESKKRKIHIKDSELISTLTSLPFLQKNNEFDPQAYDLFLKYSLEEQPRVFEEFLRENLVMAKLFEEITADIKPTDEEIRRAFAEQNEQTRVKYVFFSPGDYKNKTTIFDDELTAAYEKDKDKFKIPPQINTTFIGVELKENATEDEKTKARDTLKHAAAIAKNKSLDAAAKETNLNLKDTGLFGFRDSIPGFGWMPQLSVVLFDLPQGHLSKIIELKGGIYLFQIKEKKDAYTPELKDIKEKIREALSLEKGKQLCREKAEEFLEKTKNNPDSFEKTAAEQKFTLKETPLFSREAYIPELGLAQAVKDVAFKLAPNAVSPNVIELEQGLCVLKSIETTKIDEEKFTKNKEEFSRQFLEQRRNRAFNDFFEDLKKQANLKSYVDNLKFN